VSRGSCGVDLDFGSKPRKADNLQRHQGELPAFFHGHTNEIALPSLAKRGEVRPLSLTPPRRASLPLEGGRGHAHLPLTDKRAAELAPECNSGASKHRENPVLPTRFRWVPAK
jgi:hypothetical protein